MLGIDSVMETVRGIGSYLGELNLSALIQGVGAIWIAIVATIALHTWRKQLHAEKQLAFIDELTDTINELILLMNVPVTQLEFAQIGIEAYKGSTYGFDKYENAAAIAYITNAGQAVSARLFESLGKVKPVLGRIRSLVVKGQVLGFSDYARCQNACDLLSWTHDHIEAFSVILANDNLNWENPTVQQSLSNLSKFDPNRVRRTLQEQNAEFIQFAKRAYENATG